MQKKRYIICVVIMLFALWFINPFINGFESENKPVEELVLETANSHLFMAVEDDCYIEKFDFINEVDGKYVCVGKDSTGKINIFFIEEYLFEDTGFVVSGDIRATLNVLVHDSESSFEEMSVGNFNSKKLYFNLSKHTGKKTVVFKGKEISIHTIQMFGEKLDFWFYLEE